MMYDYDGYGARDYRVLTMDWAKKAAAGDARAQFEIGQCYFFGKSMPQDEEKAIKWYRRAAEGGCTKAMYELTLCNRDATDFGIDDSEIVKWTERFDMAYLKAAQEGDVEAMSVMADRYLTGWGVKKDIQKAIELGTKAAELGDWRAAEMLSRMYKRGGDVQKDEEKADMWGRKNIELLQRKAESGELYEQKLLGFLYENGKDEYLKRDADKAIEWYTRAAEGGNEAAQACLASCYIKGNCVERNKRRGIAWAITAAENGCKDAMLILCGAGTPKMLRLSREDIRVLRKKSIGYADEISGADEYLEGIEARG